ncbi:AraC family transcriptional regulator [Streptomyces sp. WAC 01325]|uniref:AraC family transcriptional regulator n=1 Tax=Streptomyces sp. WAC 01325 TaxID=2203202 RepID=UPI000F870B60|nr:AraC family transcriptional regulator [Streptomyces sp. WAC 01325]RSM85629.1 AraC family transcriptional regulator [Streptomyces sp. WAC 01325]
MDVVSDAVSTIRTGRPHSARTHMTAPWGLRFPSLPGAGFHIVLQGSCWLLPPDAAEPVALSSGDVVFVSHGAEIALASHPGSPLEMVTQEMDDAWAPVDWDDAAGGRTVLICGSYQLDRARLHPVLAELPPYIHLPKRVGHHGSLNSVIDLLGNELDHRCPGTDAAIPTLLDAMLLYILRSWYEDQAARSATGWAGALADTAVNTALQLIHRDPARPWTVEQLGKHAGLSRAAFARRFTALVGQPPLAYLTWWRMTTARHLLRQSDTPLRSIAEQTGYTSEFAFNRAFKREYGMTPGTYRRQGGMEAPAIA